MLLLGSQSSRNRGVATFLHSYKFKNKIMFESVANVVKKNLQYCDCDLNRQGLKGQHVYLSICSRASRQNMFQIGQSFAKLDKRPHHKGQCHNPL